MSSVFRKSFRFFLISIPIFFLVPISFADDKGDTLIEDGDTTIEIPNNVPNSLIGACAAKLIDGVDISRPEIYASIPKLRPLMSTYDIMAILLADEFRSAVLFQWDVPPNQRDVGPSRVVKLSGHSEERIRLNIPRYAVLSKQLLSLYKIQIEPGDFLTQEKIKNKKTGAIENQWVLDPTKLARFIDVLRGYVYPQQPESTESSTPGWRPTDNTLPGNFSMIFSKELTIYHDMMREIAAIEASPNTTVYLDSKGEIRNIDFKRLNTIKSWYAREQNTNSTKAESIASNLTKVRILWNNREEINRGRPSLLHFIFQYLALP